MYQYESKKPLKSAKSTSSDKGKKVASSRRVFSDSSPFPHNRQMPNAIPRSRFFTGMPAVTENKYGAGSARPPFDELPDFFPETGTNRRQVPENITSSPLIITATAPMADNKYGAEAAGRFNERTTACFGNLEFIDDVLSKDYWQDIINIDENIRVRAEQVRSCWKAFLPVFLLKNGYKLYGACQSLTYHRPSSDRETGSLDHCNEVNKSKIEGVYKSDSAIRYPRKYTDAEEIKRYLRHFAAALEINFVIKNEIQCYYDNNIVYVATNNDADSKKLSDINGTKVSEYLQVMQYSYKEIIQREVENDNPAIWAKFQGKLEKTIASESKNNPLLRRLNHPLNCPHGLETAEIKVIMGDYGITGLHAERRILYFLRETRNNNKLFLDPLRLGGIRRPCFVCSVLCFKEMSQVHPGPVWVSDAASKPRDVYEMFLILDAIRKNENLTFISLSEGHLTMANDSDSNE